MGWLRSILLIALAAAAAGEDREHVRLQLNYAHQFQFAGCYAAQARGYYADEGLDVDIAEMSSGGNPTEMLSGRSCEFAIYSPSIFRDWAEGRDLALVMVIQQRSPSALLVRQESRFGSLADLVQAPRERLVGPWYDGHVELDAGLRALGMTTRSAFPRTKDKDDFDRFVRGELDVLPGYVTNESIRLAEAGVPVRALPLDPSMEAFIGDILVCRGDTFRERSDLVGRMRRALIRGWQHALAYPEDAIDAILADHRSSWQPSTREHLRREAASITVTIAADLVPIGTISAERMRSMVQRLESAGIPAVNRADLTWAAGSEHDRWLPAMAWGLAIAVSAAATLAMLAATIRRGARRTDEVHRAMIDAADGVFLFHGVADGAIIHLDRASASISDVCGFSLREAQQDPSILVSSTLEEDRQGLVDALTHALSSGSAIRHRFRVRHARQRTTRHLLLLASPLPGRSPEYAGACIDITSEAEAEIALLDAQRRLEVSKRSESLGLLAGGVAHDFNNLLGAIRGNAELAAARTPEDSPARERIQRVLEAADRAAGLVRQILAYAGRGTIELRPIQLAEELRVLRELLRHAIPSNTSIELDIEDGLPPVMFDPAQLQQVLANLIVNAAESYDGAPGTVKVRLRRGSGGGIRLEVADQGVGMDAATQARMFEPYFTTKKNGHGLGLAAVQGITKSSGATLSCRSARGQGTVFTIDLPPGIQAQAARAGGDTPQPVTGRHILVADDDEMMRELAAHMARELGYTVDVAAGGIDAFQMLKDPARTYVLAVIDCAMPDRDGPSVLRELRAQGSRLPVLLVSGMVDAGMIGTGMLDRRTRFLAKPYSKALLDRTLRLLLRPSLEDESSTSTFAAMQRESSVQQVVRPKDRA